MDLPAKPTIAVVGTCDTKLAALRFLKQTIIATGSCDAILIDTGSTPLPPNSAIDISRSEIMQALPDFPRNLAAGPGSRKLFLDQTTSALTHTLARLSSERKISGVIGAGGSGNTDVCARAFRESLLPIGFPKVMVSTMASGDVRCYVEETDLVMIHSVVDVAGMNDILAAVLENAARAVAGMAVGWEMRSQTLCTSKPVIAITMFGVTTPCVEHIQRMLDKKGYDVVVFHATGTGGRAMERLIAEGRFVGVVDLTTTELADELVGGVMPAGPRRLEAAANADVPQVVSIGALDMVNFGPKKSVPPQFAHRLLFEHNSTVTIMRTSKEECSRLGEIIAEKVNRGDPSKVQVLLPLRGLSLLSAPEAPFGDAEADEALRTSIKALAHCTVKEVDCTINDEEFATATVDGLVSMLK